MALQHQTGVNHIIAVGVAGNETYKYIMTCYHHTLLKIWRLKGDLLATVDSKLISNHHAAVSPE